MNHFHVLEQANPFTVEAKPIQQTILRIADAICLRFNIAKDDDDLVVLLGHLADNSNQEAIATWTYHKIQHSSVCDQKALINTLFERFAQQLEEFSHPYST